MSDCQGGYKISQGVYDVDRDGQQHNMHGLEYNFAHKNGP